MNANIVCTLTTLNCIVAEWAYKKATSQEPHNHTKAFHPSARAAHEGVYQRVEYICVVILLAAVTAKVPK